MNDSPWDRNNLAENVDAYWDNANEVAFRQSVIDELRRELVPGSVLDAGCGSGRFYGLLRAARLLIGREYLGFDGSRHMLALARQHHPAGQFVPGDVSSFFHPSSNVLCIQVLQHVPDWRVVLENLLRSTEALLYLTTWFGSGAGDSRHFDPETGTWNNFLNGREVVDFCSRYGSVRRGRISDGPIGSLIVVRHP